MWKGILASGAWGLVKGLAVGKLFPNTIHAPRVAPTLHAVLLAPVIEELAFRHAPIKAVPNAPVGSTAIPFGLAHYTPGLGFGLNLFRMADAAMGGYFYERAYRAHGLAAPMAAHCVHNLATVIAGALTAGAVSSGVLGSSGRPVRDLAMRDRLDGRVTLPRRLPRKPRKALVNRSRRVR